MNFFTLTITSKHAKKVGAIKKNSKGQNQIQALFQYELPVILNNLLVNCQWGVRVQNLFLSKKIGVLMEQDPALFCFDIATNTSEHYRYFLNENYCRFENLSELVDSLADLIPQTLRPLLFLEYDNVASISLTVPSETQVTLGRKLAEALGLLTAASEIGDKTVLFRTGFYSNKKNISGFEETLKTPYTPIFLTLDIVRDSIIDEQFAPIVFSTVIGPDLPNFTSCISSGDNLSSFIDLTENSITSFIISFVDSEKQPIYFSPSYFDDLLFFIQLEFKKAIPFE